MPEKRKQTQTCHNCGLEDEDACPHIHRSSLERDQLPCNLCIRNPESETVRKERLESLGWHDFYSEQWTGTIENGRLDPTIEDPDTNERVLLQVLHALIKERR
jgi:hypothetical protein